MMRHWLAAAGIIAAPLLWTIPAGAVPLAYNESVNGDLPENSGFPVLQLDLGINTVSGTSFVNFPNGGPNSADFDSFEFLLPANTQLVSLTYSSHVTLDTTNEQTLRMEAFLDTLGPLASAACQEFYIINQTNIGPTCRVPPGNTFASALPLFAGTYLLFEGQFQAQTFGTTNWDYTWTFAVDTVPEPASIALLGAGLLLLSPSRRRKLNERIA